MVRSAKPSRKKRTPRPAAAAVIDSAPPAVVEHPDGDCWQAPDGEQKFGPSESHEGAQAERDAAAEERLIDEGWMVVRFRFDADWSAVASKYPGVFGATK